MKTAHSLNKRLCAHARARESIKMCIRHGVDVIYHGSYIDDEGMDMLEKKKDKHVVAPAINWLIATRKWVLFNVSCNHTSSQTQPL